MEKWLGKAAVKLYMSLGENLFAIHCMRLSVEIKELDSTPSKIFLGVEKVYKELRS